MVGEKISKNMMMLRMIVVKKITRNGCLTVLWRNVTWASSAPGQPPKIDKICKVLSGTLELFFCAARLSMP
jgi:hypothetical protein